MELSNQPCFGSHPWVGLRAAMQLVRCNVALLLCLLADGRTETRWMLSRTARYLFHAFWEIDAPFTCAKMSKVESSSIWEWVVCKNCIAISPSCCCCVFSLLYGYIILFLIVCILNHIDILYYFIYMLFCFSLLFSFVVPPSGCGCTSSEVTGFLAFGEDTNGNVLGNLQRLGGSKDSLNYLNWLV